MMAPKSRAATKSIRTPSKRRPSPKQSKNTASRGTSKRGAAWQAGIKELQRRYEETGKPVFPAGPPIVDE